MLQKEIKKFYANAQSSKLDKPWRLTSLSGWGYGSSVQMLLHLSGAASGAIASEVLYYSMAFAEKQSLLK